MSVVVSHVLACVAQKHTFDGFLHTFEHVSFLSSKDPLMFYHCMVYYT